MAQDAGISPLIESFVHARPENELAITQRYSGTDELLAGGSGFRPQKPEGGYSEADRGRINDFIDKMEAVGNGICEQLETKAAKPSARGA